MDFPNTMQQQDFPETRPLGEFAEKQKSLGKEFLRYVKGSYWAKVLLIAIAIAAVVSIGQFRQREKMDNFDTKMSKQYSIKVLSAK